MCFYQLHATMGCGTPKIIEDYSDDKPDSWWLWDYIQVIFLITSNYLVIILLSINQARASFELCQSQLGDVTRCHIYSFLCPPIQTPLHFYFLDSSQMLSYMNKHAHTVLFSPRQEYISMCSVYFKASQCKHAGLKFWESQYQYFCRMLLSLKRKVKQFWVLFTVNDNFNTTEFSLMIRTIMVNFLPQSYSNNF